MPASIRMNVEADIIGSAPMSALFKKARALGVTDYAANEIQIADAVSDQSILPTGISTVTAIILYSDQTISFKLNGGAAVTLTAKGYLALIDTSVTAFTVSNSSGSTANVYRLIAGS